MSLSANNGWTLFTFTAGLLCAFLKRVSARCDRLQLRYGDSFSAWIYTHNIKLWTTTTTTITTAEENNFLPSLWLRLCSLIHSLTAPGERLVLQNLARPLSFQSCHFTRPPDSSSAQVGAPDSQLNAFFSSGAKFSLRLQSFSLRFSPSSSRPDVGKLVDLCRQLARYHSCAGLNVPSPSIALLQTKLEWYTTFPNLFNLLKISNNRPVRTVCALPSLPLVASDCCAAAIGQETTVSSDCASSRLQTSWAELYCHIITP